MLEIVVLNSVLKKHPGFEDGFSVVQSWSLSSDSEVVEAGKLFRHSVRLQSRGLNLNPGLYPQNDRHS